MSLNITVVTAVIGGIDQQKEIPQQTVPYTREYFTDPPAAMIEGNDRMKALFYKCNLPHYGGDIAIWLDGKVQITSPDFIEQIVAHMQDSDGLAVLKHHERKCIYTEVDHIEHCMKKGNQYLLTRYKDKPIRRQVEAYRYFGYPANAGLWDCCIIAVEPYTAGIKNIFANWWQDVYRCNGFDQTALPFHAWREGVKIKPIVFSQGSAFKDVPHLTLK